jgi:hypothetical protein
MSDRRVRLIQPIGWTICPCQHLYTQFEHEFVHSLVATHILARKSLTPLSLLRNWRRRLSKQLKPFFRSLLTEGLGRCICPCGEISSIFSESVEKWHDCGSSDLGHSRFCIDRRSRIQRPVQRGEELRKKRGESSGSKVWVDVSPRTSPVRSQMSSAPHVSRELGKECKCRSPSTLTERQ